MSCSTTPAKHQILVRAVSARDEAADFGHLRDVLEEAAAIGVMNLLRRRPDAQLRLVVGDDAIQQDADVIVLDAAEMLLQLRPHLVDRPRRAEDRVLFAEALLAILIGIDAANRRQHELKLTVVEAAVALDADELARLELVLVAIDVAQQLGDDLSGGILQREEEKLAAAAAGANFLVGAEKVSPAGISFGQRQKVSGVYSEPSANVIVPLMTTLPLTRGAARRARPCGCAGA